MIDKIIYIGLDVDDQNFHGTAFNPFDGEIVEFKCRPNIKGLLNQLLKLKKKFQGHNFKICYEATYIGFTLQRDLEAKGHTCEVIAPNSIPRVKGNQVKTDRIDACKLAQFYASGLLTIVTPPDVEVEKDRDLMRSRQFILLQLSEVRTHIQSLLRRNNLHYKSETGNTSHWTKHHLCWLDRKCDEATGSFQTNLKLLVQQMKWLFHTRNEYDKAIDELAATERYKKQVDALVCYKGIKNIFAMVMITEIGNIKRFKHPRQLVSWMGMDIREYSSGGSKNRFGITKHGNRYLRTAFIESNQRIFRAKSIGKDLKQRRKGIDPELIQIADRCMSRLTKKGSRLLIAGKHTNKVKVACAREMVGFVWESMNKVA